MIVADMELMIDDVAHVVFTCTLGTQTPRSKHVKKKKNPHLTLWYWEQISDSFIVRVPEQCNEEQFGHLGMQVGEEN